MKILGVVFDYPGKDSYERLGAVFAKSVELNCPSAELTIERIKAPTSLKKNYGLSSNHHKFKVWNDYIQAQRDGEHVVLMDVDMLVLHDLRSAFRDDFDIGLTVRTSVGWGKNGIAYNGGVVFVKVNPIAKSFVQMWGEIDDKMYKDPKLHDPYNKVYKGQNQASLGYMVEHNPMQAHVQRLACKVWNACNEDWQNITDETRVIHIKSTLRHVLLGTIKGEPSKMRRAVVEWRKVEAQL